FPAAEDRGQTGGLAVAEPSAEFCDSFEVGDASSNKPHVGSLPSEVRTEVRPPPGFRATRGCVTISLGGRNYGPTSETLYLRWRRYPPVVWTDHYCSHPRRGSLGPDCLGHEQCVRALAGRCYGPVFGIANLFHPAAL